MAAVTIVTSVSPHVYYIVTPLFTRSRGVSGNRRN